MSFARAKNTIKAYNHTWLTFESWCDEAGRQSLPASTETVLDFVTFLLEAGRYRLSTIAIIVYSIKFRHLEEQLKNPVNDDVRSLLRSAGRKLKQRPRCKRAITPKHLRQIGEALLDDSSPMARRDHAMVLLTFAAGWRRSEVVSLSISDLWFEDSRMFVQLGSSKTDQEGRYGRQVAIPPGQHEATCPVRAMRTYLAARGNWQGPLFCRFNRKGEVLRKGITGYTLNNRLKLLLTTIGENSAPFGAHSLRSGMITSSAENGADAILIMQRTGQRSVQTVLRYIRPVAPFRADPLAGVL